MIRDSRNLESDAVLDGYDICIVGSGAAGITAAIELSKSALKVCLLESGGLEYDDDTQALYEGTVTNPHYLSLSNSRLRFFGGTTNHWEGSCRPLDPIDFERRPWVPHSGWPFDRAHLDTFYRRAHSYCDLFEYNYDPDYWRRKAQLNRIEFDDNTIETAIFQQSEPTRFGSKFEAELRESDGIHVYLHANVTGIRLDRDARHVKRLDVEVLSGGRFAVSARYYVMALGGVENARILLLSDDVMPDGVGNTYGIVGKYFMDHPVVKAGIFIPSQKDEQFRRYMGPTAPREYVSSGLQLARSKLENEGLLNFKVPFVPVDRYYASEGIESVHVLRRALEGKELVGDLWEHIGNVAGDFDMVLEGAFRKVFDLSVFDRADDGGFYVFDSMMESPPEPENKVELSADRDALGQRRVRLHYRVSPRAKEDFWRGFRIVARELGRIGVGRVRLLEMQGERVWGELMNYGSHHIGTTRAHVDPKRGVVDADLKVHGVSNLFMAGSSVFPTGGHVPPTLTIVALAIRLSQHLKRGFGG